MIVRGLPGVELTDCDRVEEPTLIDRLRAGNLEALGMAYDVHHHHVRAFARRLLGDDGAAEDLVQDAFLELPRALSVYRHDAPLRAFIIGVAANKARHYVRTAIRQRARDAHGEPTATTPSTPEDDAGTSETVRAVMRALDALPMDQRLAFVLSEVEEYTAPEIARMTGDRETTIRSRVFHAKRRLRELLRKGECR